MTYKNNTAYSEAWMYLMKIGAGFKYCRTEQWVEPEPTGIPEEDKDTMDRLKSLAVDL